jgi:hypothetical protein
VVIASVHGAMLDHILPQPQPTINPASADDNVRSMMDEIGRLYRVNKPRYFLSAESVVACAVYRGDVALQSQLDIMEGSLIGLGLIPKKISYEVPGKPEIRGKGTVIVIKKGNYAKPKILVEDGHVNA